MLSPLSPDAVQSLREAALLGERRRLGLDLAIQKRTRHTDEDERRIRRDLRVGGPPWTAWTALSC